MNAACKQKKRAGKRATLAGLLLGPLSYHACERAKHRRHDLCASERPDRRHALLVNLPFRQKLLESAFVPLVELDAHEPVVLGYGFSQLENLPFVLRRKPCDKYKHHLMCKGIGLDKIGQQL